MKNIQLIALASIAIAPFSLYAADDQVTPEKVAQWIHTRNHRALENHIKYDFSSDVRYSNVLTSKLLSTPVITQFPAQSITQRSNTNIQGKDTRALSDEAIEQAMSDSKAVGNISELFFTPTSEWGKISTQEMVGTALSCIGGCYVAFKHPSNTSLFSAATIGTATAYVTKRLYDQSCTENLKNAQKSYSFIQSLTDLPEVEFRPSDRSLQKQEQYKRLYTADPSKYKKFHTENCIEYLIQTDPNTAVEGVQNLPIFWFQTENQQSSFHLSVKDSIKIAKEEFSGNKRAGENSSPFGIQSSYSTQTSTGTSIKVGKASAYTEYVFPSTNTKSSHEWKKHKDNPVLNFENFNYYYHRCGGRLGGAFAGEDLHTYHLQEKL